MNRLEGSFGNIEGFLSLGKNIGLKEDDKDFAVLYSDVICVTAAVYTRNKIQGAPLLVNKSHLADQKAQAIVVNSRIANVATGELGFLNAKETARLAASELEVETADVLVASTGVIGPQLPMDKIAAGIAGIKQELTPRGDFAEAILTTDTVTKEICVQYGDFKIAAAAKGSGMISPNMATMLVFIATDADIAGDDLQKALIQATDQSFNMMSVDMDTSTSDMAIVMANGKVKNVKIEDFQEALNYVCKEMAKKVACDGEGATKLIISQVKGASSSGDARKVAKVIVTSNLVKTAVYGNDPNWGRIMMAIGNSEADTIEEGKIRISINGEPIVESGAESPDYDAEKLIDILKSNDEIVIAIDLGAGQESAEAYGCDMSEEYIRINAEYTT